MPLWQCQAENDLSNGYKWTFELDSTLSVTGSNLTGKTCYCAVKFHFCVYKAKARQGSKNPIKNTCVAYIPS